MTRWVTWTALDRYRDVGLLLLRVGLGGMMVGHGWPKVVAGPEKWEKLGGAMQAIGIDFAPMLWGGAAAFTEVVGGALLVVGLATRPAAALLAFTMFVAAMMHFDAGDGFRGMSHAVEDGIAFIAIVILGAGRYSIDKWLS